MTGVAHPVLSSCKHSRIKWMIVAIFGDKDSLYSQSCRSKEQSLFENQNGQECFPELSLRSLSQI